PPGHRAPAGPRVAVPPVLLRPPARGRRGHGADRARDRPRMRRVHRPGPRRGSAARAGGADPGPTAPLLRGAIGLGAHRLRGPGAGSAMRSRLLSLVGAVVAAVLVGLLVGHGWGWLEEARIPDDREPGDRVATAAAALREDPVFVAVDARRWIPAEAEARLEE